MTKVVFVTGAAKNTGLAIVRRFLREGWDACLSSRSETEGAEAVAALQAEYPARKIRALTLELDDAEAIAGAFQTIRAEFGRLDAFVSNAANLGVDYDVFSTTPEKWDAVMNVNARGTFLCCREAAFLMREKGEGGAMVLISSVHANQSIIGRVPYSASKAAVNAIARCLAVELGYLGIRVNALIAGAIYTHRWDAMDDDETARRRARYPAGRESTGDEIAAGVYYLCSDDAATVTGTEMTIDSGISVCLLPYNKDWRPSC